MNVTSIKTLDDLKSSSLENQHWENTLEALEDVRIGRVVEVNKVHAWLRSWGSKRSDSRRILK